MNKRQRKKLDKKLATAIRELNDDIAKSEGLPLMTDGDVRRVLEKVKKSKITIRRTLNDYKRFILSA